MTRKKKKKVTCKRKRNPAELSTRNWKLVWRRGGKNPLGVSAGSAQRLNKKNHN